MCGHICVFVRGINPNHLIGTISVSIYVAGELFFSEKIYNIDIFKAKIHNIDNLSIL